MNKRWVIVALAIAAAAAFAVSVQTGRWWSIEFGGATIEIGPFGAQQCFREDCRPMGLGWVGGGERWMRIGVATWAAGLLAMLALLILAGSVAANRMPARIAQIALVSIGTATVAAIAFVALFPGLTGAELDRGPLVFALGFALGVPAAVLVLRAKSA